MLYPQNGSTASTTVRREESIQSSPGPSRFDLNERIHQLEVSVAVAQRGESEAKRLLAQCRQQLMQSEKSLVVQQVVDRRRVETVDSLTEMLEGERRHAQTLHAELVGVRDLLASERLRSELESKKEATARIEFDVERAQHQAVIRDLEHRLDDLRRLVDKQRLDLLSAESRVVQTQVTYEASLATVANNIALEHQCKLMLLSHEQQHPQQLKNLQQQPILESQPFVDPINGTENVAMGEMTEGITKNGDGSPHRLFHPTNHHHYNDPSSSFLSPSSGSTPVEALQNAMSELRMLRKNATAREVVVRELQSTIERQEGELRENHASLRTLSREHETLNHAFESCKYELADAKTLQATLEQQRTRWLSERAVLNDSLDSLQAGHKRPQRALGTQTHMDSVEVSRLIDNAGHAAHAAEQLATERILWDGKQKAAEVREQALRDMINAPRTNYQSKASSSLDQQGTSVTVVNNNNSMIAALEVVEMLRSDNALLKSRVGELERGARRHDTIVEAKNSELEVLKQRVARLQACTVSDERTESQKSTHVRVEDAVAPSNNTSSVTLAAVMNETSVLRETIALMEAGSKHLTDDNAVLQGRLEDALQLVDSLRRELQQSQSVADVLQQQSQVHDAIAASNSMSAAAQQSVVDASQESLEVLRTELQGTNDIMELVAAQLLSCLGSSSTSTSQPDTTNSNPVTPSTASSSVLPQDRLIAIAQQWCNAMSTQSQQLTHHRIGSQRLMAQIAAVYRWLQEPAIRNLLSASRIVSGSHHNNANNSFGSMNDEIVVYHHRSGVAVNARKSPSSAGANLVATTGGEQSSSLPFVLDEGGVVDERHAVGPLLDRLWLAFAPPLTASSDAARRCGGYHTPNSLSPYTGVGPLTPPHPHLHSPQRDHRGLDSAPLVLDTTAAPSDRQDGPTELEGGIITMSNTTTFLSVSMIIQKTLDDILQALVSEREEVTKLRRELYDVRSALVAEIEEREALELIVSRRE